MVHLFRLLILFCIICSESQQKLLPFLKDPYEPKNFVKCFEQIGCVEVNEKWYHPEYRPVNFEPLERFLIRTDFVIMKYNESDASKLVADKIVPKKESLVSSGIKRERDTVILIHDFTSSGYTGWVKHLSKVLLRKTKSNIISVDWQKGAEPPLDQAIANARVVALEITYLVKILLSDLGVKLNDIHIIGHGVGAHIAGYVGHEHRKVKKITARSQGTEDKWGHADFYINNDELQPGCRELSNYSDLVKVDRDLLSHGEILPGCSHKRSFKYFIEALENADCVFLGIQCSTYENFEKGVCVSCADKQDRNKCMTFGMKTLPVAANHSYYLNTFSASPYCMITYSISIVLAEEGTQTGYFDMILVDDKNNVANISVVDPESQVRTFSSKSNNTYLYYASAPKLGVAKEAKVKWTVKSNILCFILCKKSIHVKEISVKLLVESHAKGEPPASTLCPLEGNGEIESSTYTVFANCEDIKRRKASRDKKNKTAT